MLERLSEYRRPGVCSKCVHGTGTSLGDIEIAIVRDMEKANGLAGWGAITLTFDF